MSRLVYLLEIWRPRPGWLVYLSILTLALCFPLAIVAGEWVDHSGVLIELGLLGGLFGTWLAGRPLRERWIWLTGILVGGVVTFTVVGDTIPPLGMLFHDYGISGTWVTGYRIIDALLRMIEPIFWAITFYLGEFLLRIQAFAHQIGVWIYIVLNGGISQDNDIFLFLNGWLSWLVAFHVMIVFLQGRNPLWAMTSIGLTTTAAVAGGRGGDGWLYACLGLATILWSQGAFLQRERYWLRRRIDYSPEIRLDAFMSGALLALLVLIVSGTLSWGIPWAGTFVRRALATPTQQVSNTLERAFGGVRKPPADSGEGGPTEFSDLPLSRILAGPPDLRAEVMLKVRVPYAPEAGLPRTYWRGMTYDQYTGRGWANSGYEVVRRPPQPIQAAYLGPEIPQSIEILGPVGPERFAAPQPVQVDTEATWVTRDGKDLVAWYADTRSYTVVSRPTMATAEMLRNASTDYPRWVTTRYLQLPADLPERVREKAWEIVGDATTAYDKAVAIEAAMRAIAYDLEVAPPPAERDIVDYFLFEMDAGYCDYFATTMTVLARAVGVPARLATGFATGRYDGTEDAFLVTGLDAHAWVEVYFPEIGWIPFEPTPARGLFDRTPPPPPLVSSDETRELRLSLRQIDLKRPLLAVAGGLILAGLGFWLFQQNRFNQLAPEDRVRALYDAIWRQAGWFGWNGLASQTPLERIEMLQNALAQRTFSVALGRLRLTWRGADAIEDLQRLGALFVKAQYSQQGVSPEEAQLARRAWKRVRGRLILLWRHS